MMSNLKPVAAYCNGVGMGFLVTTMALTVFETSLWTLGGIYSVGVALLVLSYALDKRGVHTDD